LLLLTPRSILLFTAYSAKTSVKASRSVVVVGIEGVEEEKAYLHVAELAYLVLREKENEAERLTQATEEVFLNQNHNLFNY